MTGLHSVGAQHYNEHVSPQLPIPHVAVLLVSEQSLHQASQYQDSTIRPLNLPFSCHQDVLSELPLDSLPANQLFPPTRLALDDEWLAQLSHRLVTLSTKKSLQLLYQVTLRIYLTQSRVKQSWNYRLCLENYGLTKIATEHEGGILFYSDTGL